MIHRRVAMIAYAAVALCWAQPSEDYGPHLYWDGVLNGRTVISIQAWNINIRGSTPTGVGHYRYRMVRPLPDASSQDVRLSVHSTGHFRVKQQPRRQNRYVAVLQIDTSEPTRVSFELLYRTYPHTWFDAPPGWWNPRDEVRWRSHGQGRINLVCREQHCEAKEEDSPTAQIDRFKFGLSLPAEESVVSLTDLQPPEVPSAQLQFLESHGLTARVLQRPTKTNNYATRVGIDVRDSSEHGVMLTWFHGRLDPLPWIRNR